MTATKNFTALGQSIWLDDISKGLLDDGRLERYIGELGVTGLTSNPAIFQGAIGGSDAYDSAISELAAQGLNGEDLLFALMIDDLQRAADAFAHIHDASSGVDGHVSLEVSPLLARDPAATAAQAVEVAERVGRANLLVKIPGTTEGLPAITQTIRAGIAVNVTLLFDAPQFRAANDAVREGLEQRLADGNPVDIASVASVFVSRWDKAVADKVGDDLLNRLGVNIMNLAWEEYQRQLEDPAWRRLMNHGARPQRLLWASTGTKDPNAPETLYVDELAAPLTVNTMPEKTLLATVESGSVAPRLDVDAAKAELSRFAEAGVDIGALGQQLQDDGVVLFEAAWHDVLATLEGKASQLEAQQTA